MFASYNFSVLVVAEWNSFCWCGRHENNNMIFDQNEQQNNSFERVSEDNTRWVVTFLEGRKINKKLAINER